jgi:hypothetical protein
MEFSREMVGDEKVIEGGNEFAFRQVSLRAKNRNSRRENFFFFSHNDKDMQKRGPLRALKVEGLFFHNVRQMKFAGGGRPDGRPCYQGINKR